MPTTRRSRPGSAVLGLCVIVAVLVGCGGDPEEPPARPAQAPPPEANLVAALGDSITAGAPRWDPDPAVRSRLAPPLDRRSQYGYWIERAEPETRVRNCGVSGELTAEIEARLDGCADGAELLIVQGGLNDISQGIDPPEIAGNLLEMVRRGRALGLRVAIAELLPWNGGGPAGAAAISDLNRRIGRLARREGARLLPWHDALEDPGAPGTMLARFTADGVHPSVAGYRRLAASVEPP